MVARAGYAARRLGTPPEVIAFITFTSKATEEIRQRTRERLRASSWARSTSSRAGC